MEPEVDLNERIADLEEMCKRAQKEISARDARLKELEKTNELLNEENHRMIATSLRQSQTELYLEAENKNIRHKLNLLETLQASCVCHAIMKTRDREKEQLQTANAALEQKVKQQANNNADYIVGIQCSNAEVLRLDKALAVSEAKLKKAVETLKVIANVGETIKLRYEPTWYEDLAAGTIDELAAITSESIKKGGE